MSELPSTERLQVCAGVIGAEMLRGHLGWSLKRVIGPGTLRAKGEHWGRR